MAQTKPTPLSVKDLYSVYTIGGLTKVDPQETVDFWKMVRDEVKWRAENQIAAVGNERFRWIEAHPPSWHFMKYYRYMEKLRRRLPRFPVFPHDGRQSWNSNRTAVSATGKPRLFRRIHLFETREDAFRFFWARMRESPWAMKTG